MKNKSYGQGGAGNSAPQNSGAYPNRESQTRDNSNNTSQSNQYGRQEEVAGRQSPGQVYRQNGANNFSKN